MMKEFLLKGVVRVRVVGVRIRRPRLVLVAPNHLPTFRTRSPLRNLKQFKKVSWLVDWLMVIN